MNRKIVSAIWKIPGTKGKKLCITIYQSGPQQWEASQANSIKTIAMGATYNEVISALSCRNIFVV